MKTGIILSVFFFFIGCSNCSPRIGCQTSEQIDNPKSSIGVGLLKVNMFHDTIPHQIPIFSSLGTVVDTIFYHYDSVRITPSIQTLTRFFYPEYGFIYFDVDSIDEENVRIYFGKKNYYVMQNNSAIQILSWSDFLRSVLIKPHDGQGLFSFPEQRSPNIYHECQEMMVYICDSVRGNWIHVETDTICTTGTSPFVQGWMKWKIKDSLVVNVYLNC